MKPKIIKTQTDYQAAVAHLETLMDAQPGTRQEEELELFAVLVESYEREHFPIGLPDPIEAIKFRMEQQGLTRKDLEPFIGSQSKVSEVLNRKRPLSVAMIRALLSGLDIPAEVLLQPTNQTAKNRKTLKPIYKHSRASKSVHPTPAH
jgi:HTH-type transcriptional regulator/antitoxin HigA